MIRFLLKGLLRDRSRSLFPVLTVVAGVTLTVVLYSWVRGTESDVIRASAAFATGHLRVTTTGAAREGEVGADELALTGLGGLLEELRRRFPGVEWTPRIRFAGLLDLPDERGETRAQAPVAGLAIDLRAPGGPEQRALNLGRALRSGRLPAAPGEVLVSDELAQRLRLAPGERATLIATTRFGSLTTANFTVVGTIRFGISAVDRGAILADVADVQPALDMDDAASEVLGFFPDQVFRAAPARAIADAFNAGAPVGDLDPVMADLRADPGLAAILDFAATVTTALIAIFVVVMSIVLWNAGLMASLRRYGEIGVRLAIGEHHGRIYRSLIAEALMIGLVGSLLGTALGVAISAYLEVHGVSIARFLKNASLLISDVLRAEVTPGSYLIGLVPGLLATLAGTSISGLGIFRRQTSQLAKEFEG